MASSCPRARLLRLRELFRSKSLPASLLRVFELEATRADEVFTKPNCIPHDTYNTRDVAPDHRAISGRMRTSGQCSRALVAAFEALPGEGKLQRLAGRLAPLPDPARGGERDSLVRACENLTERPHRRR